MIEQLPDIDLEPVEKCEGCFVPLPFAKSMIECAWCGAVTCRECFGVPPGRDENGDTVCCECIDRHAEPGVSESEDGND